MNVLQVQKAQRSENSDTPGAQDPQVFRPRKKKENINPGRTAALPKIAVSTPRTALLRMPGEMTVKREDHKSPPSLPSTKSNFNPEPTPGRANPTVLFIGSRKIVHTARKLTGPSQSSKPAEQSAHTQSLVQEKVSWGN